METASDTAPAARARLTAGADKVTMTRAAELLGVNRHTLRAAIDAGLIPAEKIEGPERTRFFVRLADLDDLPRCPYERDGERCERVALGPSGGCEAHGHVFIGNRAQGVKRPDIGPKITAALTGKPHPRRGKYPPEERWCEWCGISLGLVPGWKIRSGGGRFCSDPSHPMLWQWANARETFPQGGGAQTFACWICRGDLVRYPSQVEKARAERRRFICSDCSPIFNRVLLGARSRASRLRSDREAFRVAAAAGEELSQIRLRKRGRPRPFGRLVAIEVMHHRGLSDGKIAQLIRLTMDKAVDAHDVTVTRQRNSIRRRS